MTTSHGARRVAAASLLTAVLAGCAAGEPAPEEQDPAVAAEFEIVVEDGLDFEPQVLTVPAGSVVEVVNQSSRAHTVTADDASAASFDTGPVAEGDTAQFRVDEPGRYAYHCEYHPDTMTGVIVVE